MEETPEPALLDAILAAPDDDAAYLVYGDWLETQGYPRGKLVAVHAALARTTDPKRREELLRDEAEILRAHPELWPAPIQYVTCTVDWHLGFWRGVHDECMINAPPAHIEALLATRSADLVRQLDFSFSSANATDDQTFFRAAATKPRSLETLKLHVVKDTGAQWVRGDVPLALLRSCDRLRELSLAFVDQRPDARFDFDPSTAWPSLERLALVGPGIGDEQAAFLATLPRLKDVSLPPLGLTSMGIASLAALPLTSLSLVPPSPVRAGDYLPPGALVPLARHRSLGKVKVATLCPDGARALATVENLVNLCLFHDNQSQLDLSVLEHLAPLAGQLRTLSLHDRRAVPDGTWDLIARFVHVETLSVWTNAVTAQDLRALRPLRHLAHLHLSSSCVLSDEDVRFLAEFRRLESLDLAFQRGRITDACIDDIASLPSLRLVDVCRTAISARGVAELAERMPWLEAIGTDAEQREGLTDPRMRDLPREWLTGRIQFQVQKT